MNHPSEEKLVRIKRAAEFLGVSIDTVRRWEKKGKVYAIRTAGGQRLFDLNDLRQIKRSLGLSISQAAELLGISVSSLRRYEKDGLITPGRNEIGERVYTKQQLQHLSDKRAGKTSHRPVERSHVKSGRRSDGKVPSPTGKATIATALTLPHQAAASLFEKKREETERSYTQRRIGEENKNIPPSESIPAARLPARQGLAAGTSGYRRVPLVKRLLPAAFIAAALFSVIAAADQYRTVRQNEKDIADQQKLTAVIRGSRTHVPSEPSRVLGIASNQLDTFFEVNVPANFKEAVYLGPTQIDGLVTLNADIEGPGRNINVGQGTI
ncbi:MAG: hypothetical protein COT71_02725, partial [Candidatus Andersenbacteria bacterium CG10_big_fil_rev_8_21_14_0_10_54_11]